ncbi:MAG: CDP-glucose 4,6-dehydratase [Candidatus Eremiobacteraeota bacterium]|nr:CDP-glucose 4,6-dehydratase [Candidatus Eremiobacteraeota bacterium]
MSRLPDPNLWRGRRVLITGHTGFKGAWLCSWLLSLGAKVAGYALPPTKDMPLFGQLDFNGKVQSTFADIADRPSLRAAIEDFRPEAVFHLAAQALVRESYAEPLETYRVNVMGTATLLDAIREATSVRAILVVTTDKVYENRNWVWGYRETDALGGHDPYSSSKACTELVADAYRRSFLDSAGKFLATARAGNVVGGGDFATDRLVPDAIRAFSAGTPLVLRSPAASRPFQHVLDPLCGYILLTEELLAGRVACCESFNFGPNEEQKVGKAARLLAASWGPGAAVDTVVADSAFHEALSLNLDSRKAQHNLGWRPRLDFATAMDWTAHFYRGLHQGQSARSLIARDLKAYLDTQVPENA